MLIAVTQFHRSKLLELLHIYFKSVWLSIKKKPIGHSDFKKTNKQINKKLLEDLNKEIKYSVNEMPVQKK